MININEDTIAAALQGIDIVCDQIDKDIKELPKLGLPMTDSFARFVILMAYQHNRRSSMMLIMQLAYKCGIIDFDPNKEDNEQEDD